MGLLDIFTRIAAGKNQVTMFFAKYRPPKDLYSFGLKHKTLSSLWKASKRSDWLLWMLSNIDYRPACALRLFGCYCARQFYNLIPDQRSKDVIEIAERFARGEVPLTEMERYRSAAYEALTEAKRKNDPLAEAVAWACVACAKEDAFTSANDAAAYAASIADLKGGKNDVNRIQEAQAYKLRSLLGNPFEGDEEEDAKKMARGLQP